MRGWLAALAYLRVWMMLFPCSTMLVAPWMKALRDTLSVLSAM